MKAIMTCSLAALAVGLIAGRLLAENGKLPAEKPSAATQSAPQKVSYGIGLSIGQRLKNEPFKIDAEMVAQGVVDGLTGDKPAFSDKEIQEAMAGVQKDVEAKMTKEGGEQAKKGKQFLADNAKKQGVLATKSGLQYKVLKEGTGAIPKATDTVTVHYEGALTDGTVFDSSYKRGEPIPLDVRGVIPGWTEALQLMKVGAKWKLFIPPDLAYGQNPPPGSSIPPNATLVFDVELIKIGESKPEELKLPE